MHQPSYVDGPFYPYFAPPAHPKRALSLPGLCLGHARWCFAGLTLQDLSTQSWCTRFLQL